MRFVRWLLDPAVVAALLLLGGAGAFGDTPDTRDGTAAVAAWYVGHRTDVLVGVAVTALALVALLRFAGTITDRLSGAGHRGAGDLAGRTLTIAVAVLAIGFLLVHAALAYVIGAEAPASAKALFELTLLTTPLVAPFLAVVPGAVAWSLRHDEAVPRWFVAASAVAAVAIAVPTVGFAASGPLSPDVGQQVVYQVLGLWLLAAGAAWPVRRAERPARLRGAGSPVPAR